MAQLLVVDDEEKILSLIDKFARHEGHKTTLAQTGEAAVELCRRERFDLILLDIMLPDMDGFQALHEIRKTAQTPVLFLTARSEEYDRIHGFELGAEDYVVKPFSPKELMFRITAILRRNYPDLIHDRYTNGGLVVDFTAREVLLNGQASDLSPKEFDLLAYMIRHRRMALSRKKLLSAVWGPRFSGDERTLDTHIKLLRRHLEDYSELVATVRGTGYRFEG